jgi:tetratricopeptide (TPR) repeat protein
VKAFGPTHSGLAVSYFSMGSLYAEMNKLEDALSYYEKSTSIRLQALGDGHPDVASGFLAIADVLRQLGKGELPETMEYLQKAIAIQLKTLGESHPNVAIGYYTMAGLFRERQQLEMALAYCEKSISILLKQRFHPCLREVYELTAHVLKEMGRQPEADRYFDLCASQADKASQFSSLGKPPDRAIAAAANPSGAIILSGNNESSNVQDGELVPIPLQLPEKGWSTKHHHELRKCASVYQGSFICDICKLRGDGTVYHCDPCGWDAHPSCIVIDSTPSVISPAVAPPAAATANAPSNSTSAPAAASVCIPVSPSLSGVEDEVPSRGPQAHASPVSRLTSPPLESVSRSDAAVQTYPSGSVPLSAPSASAASA